MVATRSAAMVVWMVAAAVDMVVVEAREATITIGIILTRLIVIVYSKDMVVEVPAGAAVVVVVTMVDNSMEDMVVRQVIKTHHKGK